MEDIFGICLRFSDSLASLVSNITDMNWQISQIAEVCDPIPLARSELRPCSTSV